MKSLALVAVDIRSVLNVGSLFRTSDGLGVDTLYLCGITPYPRHENDERLPHVYQKTSQRLHKTALGAEQTVYWEHHADVSALLVRLKNDGWQLCALEQCPTSQPIAMLPASDKMAIIIGSETTGLRDDVLKACDIVLEIPMKGSKESFNVSVAAGIALYHATYIAT